MLRIIKKWQNALNPSRINEKHLTYYEYKENLNNKEYYFDILTRFEKSKKEA